MAVLKSPSRSSGSISITCGIPKDISSTLAGVTVGAMADKYKVALSKLKQKLSNTPTLRVGFLENATYDDGTQVALIAAVQEFGTFRAGKDHNVVIPPRPYFRAMIAKNSKTWSAALAKLLKANDYDVEKSLRLLGELIRGQLMQSIIATNSPPNAPSTIAKKGSDKPLVDSSHMLNSVDYDLEG